MGVPNLGISSFEKIFLANGYKRMDFYHFDIKKLDAYWYSPPTEDLPRVFISELKVEKLSPKVQMLLNFIPILLFQDPVDKLNLDDYKAVAKYFQTPLWDLPSLSDYELF